MQRLYTDSRLPGLEIQNDGGTRFSVVQDGEVVSQFTSIEKKGQAEVSEEFAHRRAEDYFERMARTNLVAELDAQLAGEEPTQLRKVTANEVEKAMAAARAEQEPAKRAQLQQRALRLMAREESVTEQVVNRLLWEL